MDTTDCKDSKDTVFLAPVMMLQWPDRLWVSSAGATTSPSALRWQQEKSQSGRNCHLKHLELWVQEKEWVGP